MSKASAAVAAGDGRDGNGRGGTDDIAGAPNRALQRRARCARRLTVAHRTAFLEELARSCNVTRACAAAGASASPFYKLRQRDETFAAGWDEAMATGYARLEAELMAAALGEDGGETGGENGRVAGDGAADGRRPVDRELALKLLGRRDAEARSAGRTGYGRGARTRHVPMAEVEAALRRQLDLLARRLAARAS